MQISAAMMMMYSVIVIAKHWRILKGTRYGIYLLLLLILILIGLINSYIQYQQDILFCIRRLSVLLSSVFLYFAVVTLFKKKKISGTGLKKIVIRNGLVALIAFTIQFLLKNTFIFPHVVTGFRNGRIRFYFECLPVTLLCVLSFDSLLRKKNRKIVPLLFVFLSLFDTWYIQQFRMTTLAVICALVIGYYLSKNGIKKVLVFITVCVIAGILVYTSETIHTMWNSFINGTDTFEVRSWAIPYYISHLKDHWIFGQGVTFATEPLNKAALAAGYGNWIYLNDNGIFGFIYCYGITGAIWFICFWGRILIDGYKLTKKKVYYGLMFPLYLTITLRTELHWYWAVGMINLVLFLLLLEHDLKGENNKKVSRLNIHKIFNKTALY